MAKLYYPPEDNGLQKSLDADLSTGVTASLTLNNVNKIQNKPGVMVIDRIDSSGALKDAADREYIAYTAVSGVTLTGLTRAGGGSTDQDHSVGAVVEFVPDVDVFQNITDALALAVDADDISSINTTNVVTPAGTQTLTNKTLTSPVIRAYDGWIDANETWTYASADDPTYTFTIASFDAPAKYSPGMRIKLTNASVKYFIITAVTFDDPGSTITVYGGTDYDLANSAITANYYSTQKAPLGFPLDPLKWSVIVNDASQNIQSTPTATTWYNAGTISIDIPIGIWDVSYNAFASNSTTGGGSHTIRLTLSTANNSQSDATMTSSGKSDSSQVTFGVSLTKGKNITISTKDTYYLNVQTDVASTDNLIIDGQYQGTIIIRAVCAYL